MRQGRQTMAAVVGRFGAGLLSAETPQTGRRQPLPGHLSPGDCLQRQVSPARWELRQKERTLAGNMEVALDKSDFPERDRPQVWAAMGREGGAPPSPAKCQVQPLSLSLQGRAESIQMTSFSISAGPKI